MPTPCPICDDSGLRIVERPDGTRAAQPCSCREARRTARQLAAAEIPKRYERCSFDNYESAYPGAHLSLSRALIMCRRFVDGYPHVTDGQGLLLCGPNGTGKTHLAISLLKALLAERCVNGLFVTYGDLLKQVQNSYNTSVKETESDVLRPVLTAEVLVIDELGSAKPTEWALDTVAHILNTRYNSRLTTILTTNYANQKQLVGDGPEGLTDDERSAWLALYKETLGDRIGERMRSRLQEMCVLVEMGGKDLREGVKRATFAEVEQHTALSTEIDKLKKMVEALMMSNQKSQIAAAISPRKVSVRPVDPDPVGRDRMGSMKSRDQPPDA